MPRKFLARSARRSVRAAFLLTVSGLGATVAHATDGYFLDGIGARAKGEAGVAIALPQDALSIAANPAAATELGHRLDAGVEIFIPDRSTKISGNAAGLNGSYSGNGANPFVLPEIGYVRPLSDKVSVGIAIYGNGGINTTYKRNPFSSFGATGNAGVDLKQIFIAPTLAVKVAPGHGIGVSPLFVLQGFKGTGIQPFALSSADPAHFTNEGVDWSTGAGVRFGYLGHFGPVNLGAFYQTKVWTGRFDKYAGLFAEQGGFDVPTSWGGGIAVKANGALTLAADFKRIEYSSVKSIGTALTPLFQGNPFGTANGPGFGWRDISVYKLGLGYVASPRLTFRAGYSHSQNPIPASQTFLNILAPGVVTDHLTAGATWTSPSGLEVTGYVLHAPRKTVHGSGSIPAPFGGGEADISLAETAVGLSFGWKL
ncbi:MAG: outer membrane protein transport protein [Erythrobacter sp.]|jgi:long-chain fatty acid transport protein